MTGQFSDDRFIPLSESEGTDKPVYNSDLETNPIVEEALENESETIGSEANEVYANTESTSEPMADDVPMWKPEPEGDFTDDVEGNKIPTVEEVLPESYIRPITDAQVTLLKTEDTERFQMRWNEVQGNFVDDPRAAVQQADELVSEVVELITQMFTAERNILEGQWKQGNDVSTEDLRKALQHYRSFFKRLVV